MSKVKAQVAKKRITTFRGNAGFNLVELMVTVAVLAILSAIAIPGFADLINRNRLASQANALIAVMQSARSEAIRRNQRVYVCSSLNGSSCSGTDAWKGWLIFEDSNGNAVPESQEIIQTGLFNASIELSSPSEQIDRGKFHFRADGLARSKHNTLLSARFKICAPVARPAENIREVGIASGSRFNITRQAGKGKCE